MPSNTPSPYRRPWSNTETTALPRSYHVPSIHTMEGIGENLPPMPSPDNGGPRVWAYPRLRMLAVVVVPVMVVVPEGVNGRLDPVADHAFIGLALVRRCRIDQRPARVEEPIRHVDPQRDTGGLPVADGQRRGQLDLLLRVEIRRVREVAAGAAMTEGPRHPNRHAVEPRNFGSLGLVNLELELVIHAGRSVDGNDSLRRRIAER